MKSASIIKAIQKSGFQVVETDRKYMARNGDVMLSWFKSSYGDDVRSITVSNLKDPNQSEIDYFTDIYCDTIKSALNYLVKGR